jgi:L-asparaginase/Glu-tRNA(Gln) amidotransferase subunit D
MRVWLVVLCLFLVSVTAFGDQVKKKILIIGTGGTIAGEMKVPGQPGYDPAKMSIDAILEAVPEIRRLGDISGEQLYDPNKNEFINVPSPYIKQTHWLSLANRINRALESERYDAVIVTHGTDTLEETSFFLNLTVRSSKPVILVGSMRPANHAEPDGPQNIRNAVRVAASSQAQDKGVMVVLNKKVFSALDVTKFRTFGTTEPLTDAFTSPNYPILAKIEGNAIYWNKINPVLKWPLMKYDIFTGTRDHFS